MARLHTALLGLMLLIPCGASAAPPQLLNKSVSVGMSISVNARAEDGSVANRPRNVQRTIYISSQGRLFIRVTRQAGSNMQSAERGPEETAGSFRFAGNQLIGVMS